jgi:branched-chain amino acid transport system permease protein
VIKQGLRAAGSCPQPLQRRAAVFIGTLVNGIAYGMILFLIACGFSLIFGVMGILNLAHGALYMLGAYFGLTLAILGYKGYFLLAALIGALGAGLMGIFWERIFLSRLYKQLPEQVLLTLGLIYIFSNLVLWVYGPMAKMGTPPAFASSFVRVFGTLISTYRLFLIVIGIFVAVGMYLFQEKTRYGAIIRAGLTDKEMTIALGINYRLVSSLVFFLGASMAGFAGFLGTPIIGALPTMSFDILLLAVAVMVIGGIGYIEGALLGAMMIGLIDSFGKVYFPDFALFTIYVAMIIILLVRPIGLLGRSR